MQKNPQQHTADFKILMTENELKPVFYGSDLTKRKPYTCVTVDGASDEVPSHLEVQFVWIEFYIQMEDKLTCVSTRCNGQSYLNRIKFVYTINSGGTKYKKWSI